jgi:hypothetical protein
MVNRAPDKGARPEERCDEGPLLARGSRSHPERPQRVEGPPSTFLEECLSRGSIATEGSLFASDKDASPEGAQRVDRRFRVSRKGSLFPPARGPRPVYHELREGPALQCAKFPATESQRRRDFAGRLGQRAKILVFSPPRGVNSPRTTHHSGWMASTMSCRILLTAFS